MRLFKMRGKKQKRIFSALIGIVITIAFFGVVTFVFNSPKKALADSLFSLNEGYGTSTNDSSNNVSAGTISGATWKTDELCFDTKCLYFDGVQDYVSFADDADLDFAGGDSFTVMAWFRHAPKSSGTDIIVGKILNSDNDGGYQIQMESDGDITCEIEDDDADTTTDDSVTSTAATYDDNQWHHVACVKSTTSSLTLYIDGNQIGQDASLNGTGTLANDDTFYIGMDGDGTSNDFTGFIDEVKVYRSARTAVEIKSDFGGNTTTRGTSASFGPDQSYLTNGLIGYWKMDESGIDSEGESISDHSGNSKSGTLYGDNGVGDNGSGMNCTSGGKYGSACDLDGTDDYVEVSSPSLPTGDFTYSVWFNPTNAASTDTLIMSPGSDGSNELRIYISGSVINFNIDAGSNVAGTTTLSNSTWYHMALTRSGSNITLYLNSASESTSTDGDVLNFSTCSLYFGLDIGSGSCTSSPSDYWQGTIDGARIYNRALSPTEIAKLYNWAPGPTLYYSLDENTGTTTVNDRSGNLNNGTMTSMESTDWVPGKFGSSLEFDGTSDYINTGETMDTIMSASESTISLWVKPTTAGPAVSVSYDGDRIFGDASTDANCNNCFWGIYQASIGGSDRIWMFNWDGNEDRAAITYSVGEWVHITWVHSGGSIKAYKNGVLVDAHGSGNTTATAYTVYIGGGPDTGSTRQFTGNIDDIRVYNYARTPAQIIEDMNAGHPAPGSPVGSPTLWWKIDEGYGTTMYDSGSTGNYDGTASGSSRNWSNDGKFGKSYDLEGSDGKVSAGDVAFTDSLTGMTISMWLNPTVLLSSQNYISKTNHSNQNSFYVRNNSGLSDEIQVFIASSLTDTTNRFDSSNLDMTTGSWIHLLIVYDGTATASNRLKVYKNAKQVAGSINGTIPTSMTSGSTSNLTIGISDTASVANLRGYYDEVKIYTFPFTEDQIKAEYNGGFAQQMGATSTDSSGIATWSDTNAYCPPGQGSTCTVPVGHWKLDENTSTTANDVSGNDNSATLTNTPTWTPGKYGAGVAFAGSDQHITRADDSDFDFADDADMTVMTWFKHSTASAQEVILSKYNEAGYKIIMESDGDITCALDYDSTWTPTDFATSTAATYDDGNWHHIACVKSGATSLTLYIDGIAITTDSSITATNTLTNSDPIYFGIDADGTSNDFTGSLDDIKIYTTARTQAQISWDYNLGKPLGWWKMDESLWDGTAFEVKDSSGNNMRGTRGGDATTTTGKFNNGGTFDGTGDYVNIPHSAVQIITGSYTLSTWFNATSWPGGGSFDSLISKSDSNDGYWMEINDTDDLNCGFGDGSEINHDATAFNGTTGVWYHAACVFDTVNNTMKIYINGNEAYSATENSNPTSEFAAFTLGAYNIGTSQFYSGKLDDARLFNYPLTPQQIKLIMNEGAAAKF